MDGPSRLVQLAAASVLAAAGIVWHLWDLQVRQQPFWEHEAIVARTRKQTIPFGRGSILDAAGRPLATTRTVDDLEFVFGSFRKEAAGGQLLLSHYLLTGERLALAAIYAQPEPTFEQFATVTIGEMRALEPGARRADLLSYAAWLVGEESTRPLVERLRDGAATELFCPDLLAARRTILTRVQNERQELATLERALGLGPGTLVAKIDAEIRAIDTRVVALLARRDRPEMKRKLFEAERELHKDEDYRERLLLKNVAHAAVFDLAADPQRLPGLVVAERTRRVYPADADVCALLIGKVGPPSKEALDEVERHRDDLDELCLELLPTVEQSLRRDALEEQLREVDPRPDEEVGKDGLEGSFEAVLRGRRGYRRTENDRSGRELATLEEKPPEAGRDLVLTLDVELQRAAEAALARGVAPLKGQPRKVFAGAVVLLELPAMKVRVLASCPSPSREKLQKEFADLAADTRGRPLHPRAWGPYVPPPPGSSIKPLLAALALSAGDITAATRLECSKDQLRATPKGQVIKCEGLHHDVDVHGALVKSCNHYFARLAGMVGADRMVEWAHLFGLGQRTGFTGALLPDGTSIRGLGLEAAGNAGRESDLRSVMIEGMGQGKFDVTPLQMAAAIGALALGAFQPPTLIERVGSALPLRPDPHPLPITPSAWETTVAAMREVTHAEGTAAPGSVNPDHDYDLTPFDLATKTGTPEQAGGEDHSWFVGFFPSHAPRYAFAVFLERTGEHGGTVASPLFAELLQDPAWAGIAAVARDMERKE